jgi:hypothetical protein
VITREEIDAVLNRLEDTLREIRTDATLLVPGFAELSSSGDDFSDLPQANDTSVA